MFGIRILQLDGIAVTPSVHVRTWSSWLRLVPVCRFLLENWVLDRWVRNILTVYPVVIVALVGNVFKHFNPADPTPNSVFVGECDTGSLQL